MSIQVGGRAHLPFYIDQASLIANTSIEIVSPCDGWISEIVTVVKTAVTTGGTITVLTGDAGATTVLGIAHVIPNAAAKGTRSVVGKLADPKSPTRAIVKGQRIQIKPTSFATAGVLDGFLLVDSSDMAPAYPS